MGRLNAAARAVLGEAAVRCAPMNGGDLSDVVLITLASGQRAVAKTGPFVAREARMLQTIRDAGAPAPAVLGLHGDILLLEALDEMAPTSAGWAALGRGLRQLHATTGASYGWAEDYGFGSVPVINTPTPDWPGFWAKRRLLVFGDRLPADLARRVEALAARLPELLPHAPQPALLHGDLWTGNALFSGDTAFLIDPACYFGDPEVDLAMLELFGNPSPAFADAYGPLAPGANARRPIYQLWPALVHFSLFGAGYRGLVERCLVAAGA
ncbi:fructosamine kinase family protein [Tropicimonas sp. IMCC34043]|uniref:fructosamine kinase family protein n=1 Tax=Tropicimonas sp. IMCC34043 TaxID=2248760 RepID=UPI000E2305D3|nr:fructosamine kinase family protein [Tropicimonas sp. IMCC34043]